MFNNHLFHSTLLKRDREWSRCDRLGRRGEYQWAQHVRMAKSAGLSDEEVDAIMAGPDSPVWESRTLPCCARWTRLRPIATSVTRPGSDWPRTSTASS